MNPQAGINIQVIVFPGNEALGQRLCQSLGATEVPLTLRQFPDGESYVRNLAPVAGRVVIVIATLDQPDRKLVPLYLLCASLRDQGAARIVLVAPYLAYMRQDIRFNDGEAISARYVGAWFTPVIDALVTVDPHLHRIHDLSEVYRVPCEVVAAAPAIAQYVQEHLTRPLLIGPDGESEQWVAEVAARAGCAYSVLHKVRHGDRSVSISALADVDRKALADCTPVLVDDIISTAHTMAGAAQQLRAAGTVAPICIGVHAIFAGDAAQVLADAGVAQVITGNTIRHASNAIDLNDSMVAAVRRLL